MSAQRLIRDADITNFGGDITGWMIELNFILLAVIMDYIFFGIIRNAMEQLYHPTTFYGYGFLICLPFIAVLGFRKRIERNKKEIHKSDFIKAGTIGLICFGLLTLIIIYGIEI